MPCHIENPGIRPGLLSLLIAASAAAFSCDQEHCSPLGWTSGASAIVVKNGSGKPLAIGAYLIKIKGYGSGFCAPVPLTQGLLECNHDDSQIWVEASSARLIALFVPSPSDAHPQQEAVEVYRDSILLADAEVAMEEVNRSKAECDPELASSVTTGTILLPE